MKKLIILTIACFAGTALIAQNEVEPKPEKVSTIQPSQVAPVSSENVAEPERVAEPETAPVAVETEPAEVVEPTKVETQELKIQPAPIAVRNNTPEKTSVNTEENPDE